MMYRRALARFSVGFAVVAMAACRAPNADPERIEGVAEVRGEVTIAGCLQQADEGRFVLEDAVLARDRAGIPVRDGAEVPPVIGTTGSTGTIPATVQGPDYAIEAPPEINLQPHVGRQVQVTGALEQSAGGGPAGTAEARRGGEADEVNGRIAASEIRLVAAECM